MNQEQFKQFLYALQANQQKLIEHFSSQQQQSTHTPSMQNVPATNTTLLPQFEAFDTKKESFKYYKQRFENYLTMKNVFSDKKLSGQMLLNSTGAAHYHTVVALVAPKKPNEMSYDELVSTLEKHLCPKKNVLVAQHRFLSTYQSEKQSIAEYVAELRKEMSDCEFTCECQKSIDRIFLRAQFIRGLFDNSIREHLLQSDLTEFKDIVSKSIALEAAKIDSRELSSKLITTSSGCSTDVNKISKHNKIKGNTKQRHRSKSRQRQDSRKINIKSKIDYHRLGIGNLCLRCGRDNHIARDCRCDQAALKCKACSKTGHVQKVCTLLETKKNFVPAAKESTNQVQNEETYKLYGINKIIDIFDQPRMEGADSEKFYTTVLIDNKPQQFEVDSGAGFTLIPRKEFKKLQLNCQLQKSTIAFRSYTQQIFVPDGKARVQVKYNNTKSMEDMYIVPNEYEALLGRTWIRHLNVNLQELDEGKKISENQMEIKNINNIEDIIKQFPEIFEEKIGCVPNFEVHL